MNKTIATPTAPCLVKNSQCWAVHAVSLEVLWAIALDGTPFNALPSLDNREKKTIERLNQTEDISGYVLWPNADDYQVCQFRKHNASGRVTITPLINNINDTNREIIQSLEQKIQYFKERLEQESKAISTASHEFRGKITTAEFILQNLVKTHDYSNDPHTRQRIALARKALKSAIVSAETALLFYRFRDAKVSIGIEEVSLLQFAQELADDYRSFHPEFQFSLNVDLSENANVFGNKDILNIIMSNILDNAIKYSGKQHQIDLSIERVKQGYIISVTDYGVGIPACDLDRIFEQYFRSDQTQFIYGVGVGLYFSKELVQLLNGKIWAESQLNQYTTFFVWLPNFAN